LNQLPPHPPVEPEAASENLAAAGLPERVVAETPQPPTTQPIPELPGPAVVVERPPPELIAGRYSIERELARGGMGRIYVAYDRVLGRPVALKMLKKAHGPVSIERFRREARAVSGLSHPNIVAIHDAGDENGEPYIVQELLSGRTLRRLLAEESVSLRDAIDLGLQCARGLSAAHVKSIVHRDLKPENLFLTDHGVLKILDFGLAKLLPASGPPVETLSDSNEDDDPNSGLTRAGQVLGTVGYMAPEQVRGEEVDLRADLFLLGLVLYELVSRRRAFQGLSAIETSYAIVSKEPAPLDPSLPATLRDIIGRCLSKEQASRPLAAEVVQVLEKLLLATPSGNPPLSAEARRRFLRSRRAAAAALLFVALGGAVWAAFSLLHQAPPSFDAQARKVIAVLPLTVLGGPQFDHLGEDLVQLIGAGLTHDGLRAVDPQTILRMVLTGKKPLDLPLSEDIARRFGADVFVTGSVLEDKGKLAIRVELHRFGRTSSAKEAHAIGDASQLFALVDQLCAELERSLGGVEPPDGPTGRLPRLARTLTSSESALSAYLRGEAALRRDDWDSALAQFQSAVSIDPGFALAQYRLAITASVQKPEVAVPAIAQAMSHRDRLETRDRDLLEAFDALLAGRANEAEKRYRAIVKTYPDDVDGWFQLGETLYHFNAERGRSLIEAEAPFGQVLQLDPEHVATLDHMLDIAQLKGQRDMMVAYADRALALAAKNPDQMVVLPVRWARAWAKGDAVERELVLRQLADPDVKWEAIERATVRALWQKDDLTDAMSLARLATERRDPADRADGLDLEATIDLALGRRKAAQEKLDEAARLKASKSHAYYRLWPGTLDFFPPERASLQEDFKAASHVPGPQYDFAEAFLRGAIAVRLHDEAHVRIAIDTLSRMKIPGEGSVPQDLAFALKARLADAEKNPEEARRFLGSMKLEVPYAAVHRFSRLGEPLLRMKLSPEEAPRLEESVFFYDWRTAVFFAPVARLRGQQLEKSDREAALLQYRRYLELRKGADPELAAEVQTVRERVQQLSKP
jgi:hypothetical protein